MTPAVWNLRVLFTVGIVLASVACVSSLLLLSMSLNSWQEGSIYQRIGLGGISYGQVTTSIYLKVSVSDFLTLFSARAGEEWFWSSRPSPILLGAGALALATSTALACLWPLSRPDGIPTLGLLRRGNNHILPVYIWIYCIVWWFIQVHSALLASRIQQCNLLIAWSNRIHHYFLFPITPLTFSAHISYRFTATTGCR